MRKLPCRLDERPAARSRRNDGRIRARRLRLRVVYGAWTIIIGITPAHTPREALSSPQQAGESRPSLILGLDHIPIAVADLQRAAVTYDRMGFVLKPGRPHANGIQNRHIKFPDGTEIELITAPEARDRLTSTYRRHLASGDGPAFAGFYAPDLDALMRAFDAAGRRYHVEGGLVTFAEPGPVANIFFGRRNQSPTDRPEHFRHRNSAESLMGFWLAGENLTPERRLLEEVGAILTEREVHVPDAVTAPVARLQQAEVLLLPGHRQIVSGRKIVGATVRVRDLAEVRRVWGTASMEVPAVTRSPAGQSLFLPPEITHGIWLEFRQQANR